MGFWEMVWKWGGTLDYPTSDPFTLPQLSLYLLVALNLNLPTLVPLALAALYIAALTFAGG